jgi:hypothetical protein
MQQDYFTYFTFDAKLEHEKTLYNLNIRLFYNSTINRKEFEVLCDHFTAPKLLVYEPLPDKSGFQWTDVHSQDNSAFVQELGSLIFRKNI